MPQNLVWPALQESSAWICSWVHIEYAQWGGRILHLGGGLNGSGATWIRDNLRQGVKIDFEHFPPSLFSALLANQQEAAVMSFKQKKDVNIVFISFL